VIEMIFQSIQTRRPQPAVFRQPIIEFGQRLGPDAIEAALGVRASLNHSRLFEHPQVLRHGRLAQVEIIHELSYRSLPLSKEVKDGPSAGRAQDVKGGECRHRA
jgi:hypothetical protein